MTGCRFRAKAVLLAIDIGNSNVKFGTYLNKKLQQKISVDTASVRSVSAVAAVLADQIDGPIERAIVTSVVPTLNDVFADALTAAGATTRFVENTYDFGLDIRYYPLEDAGTDRLINCFAASEKFGRPCIVCSFGTALTLDAVDGRGVLLGGLIAPGIRPMIKALNLVTARLPEVEIVRPAAAIQNTTVGSIQSGVVNGYFAMFEGLLQRVKAEMGGSAKVIATGGHVRLFGDDLGSIDIVDHDLTLDGLCLLDERS